MWKDKTLLLVNTGSIKKRFILQRMKKLGVNIIALNKEKNWAAPYVDYWILTDTTNHKESMDKLENFTVKNPNITIEGVLTFWEDDVLLCSKIVDAYGFKGISYDVSRTARNKALFRQFCQANNLPVTRFMKIFSESDLDFVIKNFNFPVVVKPSYGSSSALVVKAENEEELRSVYVYVKENLSTNIESALGDGMDIMVEEYIDGDEVDIDILIQNGRIKFYCISDNTKTKEPFFIETDRYTPSQLPKKDQDALIQMADEVLEKLGVQDGCIHFEAKSTKKGPVPLEVNLRMGGDEIYSSVKKAWKVDLIEGAMMIACGIHIPKITLPENPACHLIARTLTPEFSGILSNLAVSEKISKLKFLEEIDIFKKIGDPVFVPPEGYEYLGWLMVSGDNHLDSLDNLSCALEHIKYEVAKFHKESTIGSLIRKEKLSGIRIKRIEKLTKISHSGLKSLKIGILSMLGERPEHSENLISKTLSKAGYSIETISISDLKEIIEILKKKDLDLIINAGSKNPVTNQLITSVLDILEIPYLGSAQVALALSSDKMILKKLLNFHGIPTPKWDYAYEADDPISDDLAYPLIIKPARLDYGIGISEESIVHNKEQRNSQISKIISAFRMPVIIEEFIHGNEFSVPIIGNDKLKILPIIRKNQKLSPVRKISKNIKSLVTEMAMDTYNIVDCRDYGIVDIIVDKKNNPFVLEINSLPLLSEDSIFNIAAKEDDRTFLSVIEDIMQACVERSKKGINGR
ncbi:ATP-grasp domain-containing protein [Candidatus Woesearchaeota archaeon]|nr:ATP-grasp domain-containing protein [Candidatus Woesearchaeota archaeon]